MAENSDQVVEKTKQLFPNGEEFLVETLNVNYQIQRVQEGIEKLKNAIAHYVEEIAKQEQTLQYYRSLYESKKSAF